MAKITCEVSPIKPKIKLKGGSWYRVLPDGEQYGKDNGGRILYCFHTIDGFSLINIPDGTSWASYRCFANLEQHMQNEIEEIDVKEIILR